MFKKKSCEKNNKCSGIFKNIFKMKTFLGWSFQIYFIIWQACVLVIVVHDMS